MRACARAYVQSLRLLSGALFAASASTNQPLSFFDLRRQAAIFSPTPREGTQSSLRQDIA
jgi:hypothetical protein